MPSLRACMVATLIAHCALCRAVILDRGNTTVDTRTNLEWLDLTATRGISFDQVQAATQPGNALYGWRFAYSGEALALFSDLGLPTWNGTYSIQPFAYRVTLATGLLGNTIPDQPGLLGFFGQVADTAPSASIPLHWKFGAEADINWQSETLLLGPPITAVLSNAGDPHVGSFLVRQVTPVPEPGEWLLIAAGVIAIAVIRRRCPEARSSLP